MPRDPSKIYYPPSGTNAVTGTPISSAAYNNYVADMTADANNPRPVVAGGTGGATAAEGRQNIGAGATAGVVDKAAGTYSAVKADHNYTWRATGAVTVNLTAAATLTDGWCMWVKGDGGAVTVVPNGSEQINGAATLSVPDGSSALIICTGSAFRATSFASASLAIEAIVHAASSKATPVDADETMLADSAASWGLKKLTWANIKATLKTYFDTLYYIVGGTDVAVADGGTGRSSHTAYAVVCGGTTTTAAQQSIASVGSSGQVLTSNGAAALPTFQSIDISGTLAGQSAGDVGSMAFLAPVNSTAATYNPGATLAGSALNYAGIQVSGGAATRGTTLSGTWRCMGQSARGSVDSATYASLWLRIS